MNLEQSTVVLIQAIEDKDRFDNQWDAASCMHCHLPEVAGITGLQDLETVVTLEAIAFFIPEIHAVRQQDNEHKPIKIIASRPTEYPKNCINPTAYHLLYHHIMQSYIQQDRSILYSLIHPHWFLCSDNADISHEGYQDAFTKHYLFQAGEALLIDKTLGAESLQNRLPLQYAEVYDIKFAKVAQEIREEYHCIVESGPITESFASSEKQLPIPPPHIVFPRPTILSKSAEPVCIKAYGKAKAHLPTATELAGSENKKRQRAFTIIIASEKPPLPIAPARLEALIASRRSSKRRVSAHIQAPIDLT